MLPDTRSLRSTSATTAGNSGSFMQSGPTLTEIGMSHPSAAQIRCWARDSLSMR